MSTEVDYKALYEQSQAANAALQMPLLQLTQQLAPLQKMIFGSRQERLIPADPSSPQLSLGIQTEPVVTAMITSSKPVSYIRNTIAVEAKPVQHPGRMKLPESLRREEITEVLEYAPGELYVKQYRRAKYAQKDNSGVVIGQLPSRPLEKAMAGEGLLAQLIIDKYVDHLPLYRQMQRFERAGVKLAYSTLTDWVSGTCHLIAPLFEALRAEVLQSTYLHADETPIKVLDKKKEGEAHRGFYWVYQNSLSKIVLFDYREGRGREGPEEILQGFQGYLQTDGYAGYGAFAEQQGVTLIHCMAHARRKFHDALSNDETRASHALQEIQKLYAIERICKDAQHDFAATKEVRQRDAVPVLKELGGWLQQQ